MESKNPKFMSTIEEYNHGYNNMLSASAVSSGQRKLVSSVSQAQLEMAQVKPKVQTVVNSNQTTIKRQTNVHQAPTLSASASVSNFKGSQMSLQAKKRHLP